MRTFCRTCFRQSSDNALSLFDLADPYKFQLMFCVPEMDLQILTNIKLCKDCVETLSVIYKFKLNCREVENKINNGQFNIIDEMMVKQQINLDSPVYAICRTCFVDITDRSLLLLSDESFCKRKLVTCVPEINLKTTPVVNLCDDCNTILNRIYKFKMKCFNIEKVLKLIANNILL